MTSTTNPMDKVPAEFKQENGKYRPGYDAKHAGIIARRVLETGKTSHLSELPTEALKTKASRLVELWTAKAEAKQEAEAKRAEAKQARESAKEAEALAKAEAKAEKDEAKAQAARVEKVVKAASK